jgi:hypothetical protein
VRLKVKLSALAATAVAMLCFGVSMAAATISPTSGSITGTNSGNIVLTDTTFGLTNTCTSMSLGGSITINNASGDGGGGLVTSWTHSGCSPDSVAGGPTSSTDSWTLDLNNNLGSGEWSGTVVVPSDAAVTIDSICSFTGTLDATYENSTGELTLSGGSLSSSLCGDATVTGNFILKTSTGAFPTLS